jgi:hypothetical protein
LLPPKKIKKPQSCPYGFKRIKKPWGPLGHPWLSIPRSGLNLWVTLSKIKIKEIKVENLFHRLSFELD